MGNGSQPIAHSAVRPDVRFGSLADICAAKSDVRFSPNSDRKSGFAHEVMSALLPKADMCGATMDVRFGPIADFCRVGGCADELAPLTQRRHRTVAPGM
jgi:hypothetical protein